VEHAVIVITTINIATLNLMIDFKMPLL